MRLGLFTNNGSDLDGFIASVREAADLGFASAWTAQIFGLDALTAIAVAGREVPGIELGTSVVPTYPRHPMMMAGQALTVQAAIGNRLALGIGLSHQVVVEGMWGYSFDKPARHMKEYLAALMPLLRGEAVGYQGDTLKAFGQLTIANAAPPPVLLAALAPAMLRLAGAVADGTSTWMVGPKTLATHITPAITAAATDAGRPAPRIGSSLPICVTNDADAARERAAKDFVIYGQLPSYRAMLDIEGAAGPADIAIVGDEAAVIAGINAMRDAGCTDFVVNCFGTSDEVARTKALVASLL
jgi:F420-dependent oxidoreductase-like protein